jgi:DNA-binding winged helix-turn-helix (wHTH) protein
MTTIVDSLVAPLSVINALIVILCQNKRDEVVKRMDALDQIWEDYQFYSNDELSQVGDSIRIKYKDPEDAL